MSDEPHRRRRFVQAAFMILGTAGLAVQHCCAASAIRQGDGERAELEVRVQVCVPTKRVYFNDLQLDTVENFPGYTHYSPQQLQLVPNKIRRVAPSDDPRVADDPRVIRSYGVAFGEVLGRPGDFSDSSGFMALRDATVGHQPIYGKEGGHPARKYIAVHLRLYDEPNPAGPTYWFKLPKAISADRFTNWFGPTSIETGEMAEKEPDRIWRNVTHEGKLPIHSIPANAPKMRVKLQEPVRRPMDPASDWLPALTTARLRFQTATSGPEFVHEFVAKSNEAIPNCD
jgi:hypothetical protein